MILPKESGSSSSGYVVHGLEDEADFSSALPCNCTHCPIHIPIQSFTSPKTNLFYSINALADYKSSNLVYQLHLSKENSEKIVNNSVDSEINGDSDMSTENINKPISFKSREGDCSDD